jgi:ribose/xylose/arabinose/galactoside ABC-type transport system permease subunit
MRIRVNLFVSNALLLGLIGLSSFFATQSSAFLAVGNFRIIAENSSILGVAVVTSAFLILAGHLDLSIGSTVGLSATLTALAVVNWHWNPAAAMALAIAAGAGVGVVNGFLCAVLGWSPIIVTLGMLGVVRGMTLIITEDQVFGLGSPFTTIATGRVAGVPILVLTALGFFAVGWMFLVMTPWGRYVYAVGVNPQAAFLSGLPVRLLPFFLYVATGASAGVAGILFVSRLDGVSPADVGTGLELNALTAILLGGVAFAGGRGKLSGVFIAVLFLGVLQDGLILMNVQPFIQTLAQGLALVGAAGLDVVAQRLSTRNRARVQIQRQLGIPTESVSIHEGVIDVPLKATATPAPEEK